MLRVSQHSPEVERPAFYYDLVDPVAYLSVERMTTVLTFVPEFRPVLASRLPDEQPWAADPSGYRAAAERQALAQHVLPLCWPPGWPATDTELAMLLATYARAIGKVVAYSLAAFRQAFAGGADLGRRDTLLIAAAACEIHPRAALAALGLAGTRDALAAASAEALAAGVRTLPALVAGERVFSGTDALEATAAALTAAPGPATPPR